MSETLYMKLEQNPQVTGDSVHISDISETWCRDKHVLARCRAVKVKLDSPEGNSRQSRTIYSAMDLVQMIQEEVQDVEVTVLGEQELVIAQKKEGKIPLWLEWCKTILIAVVIFCGSAFAIMTFNNDVGVKQVFDELYEWIMGRPSDGFSLLEISYTVGLAVGILVFYNHFRRKTRLSDPTPLEVQMRQYEYDINTAILREDTRNQKHS